MKKIMIIILMLAIGSSCFAKTSKKKYPKKDLQAIVKIVKACEKDNARLDKKLDKLIKDADDMLRRLNARIARITKLLEDNKKLRAKWEDEDKRAAAQR